MLKKVHGLKSYSRGLARQIVDRQDIMVAPNEVEDKNFLIENQIKSIFCISHHSNNFPSILPHLKMMLQEYDGWIGNDEEGFQPCYDMRNIDLFH